MFMQNLGGGGGKEYYGIFLSGLLHEALLNNNLSPGSGGAFD